MGNFAALVGCPSKEAAQTENLWDCYWDESLIEAKGWGPVWTSKYCIGGFWLACFSPEDEILIERSNSDDSMPSFAGYFVEAHKAVERLNQNKEKTLSLIPKQLQTSYSELYDAWIHIIESQFKSGILLDCDDIFGMIGHAEGSEGLREHVNHFASLALENPDVDVADFGLTGLVGLGEVSPYEVSNSSVAQVVGNWRFAATGDPNIEITDWPPHPHTEELELAKSMLSDSEENRMHESQKTIWASKPWWKFW
ncbi:MAG: hypothetical protein ACSHX3_14440 [Litorimonas sp.]